MKVKITDLDSKNKKMTELQAQMKRDETVLKKAIEENGKLKREAKKAPTAVAVKPKDLTEENIPDADEIKNQFMDKLSSKLEHMFDTDNTSESIKTSDLEEAENAIKEVSQSSLDDKEKILAAVKQNVDQMKSDFNELLKNTWASKIADIQKSMLAAEADRKKLPQPTDSKMAQHQEREFNKKMEDYKVQLDKQHKDKSSKEESIQKLMVQQETRIKALESDLQKIKKEKEEMETQKKYGEERFHKFKSTTTKETATFKKAVSDKEKTVSKLKSDLKKNDHLMNQKI